MTIPLICCMSVCLTPSHDISLRFNSLVQLVDLFAHITKSLIFPVDNLGSTHLKCLNNIAHRILRHKRGPSRRDDIVA